VQSLSVEQESKRFKIWIFIFHFVTRNTTTKEISQHTVGGGNYTIMVLKEICVLRINDSQLQPISASIFSYADKV
jgi:hypothetical protein